MYRAFESLRLLIGDQYDTLPVCRALGFFLAAAKTVVLSPPLRRGSRRGAIASEPVDFAELAFQVLQQRGDAQRLAGYFCAKLASR